MFNSDFYPTPHEVWDLCGIDCYGKICYEPSSGKGDTIDWLKKYGAKEVIASEIHPDLHKLSSYKAKMIGTDFFKVTSADVSHVQIIIMNPPFSNARKHILHAWEIAPEGCEIYSLFNYANIESSYSRDEFLRTVENYGDYQNLGKVFKIAERTTDVEVGLVKLFKPVVSEDFNYEGFFLEEEPEQQHGDGVMTYNEIRAIVNSYIGSVRCWDRFQVIKAEMDSLTIGIGCTGTFEFQISYNKTVSNKADFAKAMQVQAWNKVFKMMNITKYVTKGVQEDINRFVEQQSKYPFTMRNVFKMLDIIIGTRSNTMKRAVVEAVDNFTKYTDENRFGVEGWKTNLGHMLNKKFIVAYVAEPSYRRGLNIKTYQSSWRYVEDLSKALCFLTGNDYDKLCGHGPEIKDHEPGQWYSWGFFEYRLYKKGSAHFKFQREEDWETLNIAYAKALGMKLPENLFRKEKKEEPKPEAKPEPARVVPMITYTDSTDQQFKLSF